MKKTYNERTDAEVLAIVKDICNSSTTAMQVAQRIRNELVYRGDWLRIIDVSIGSGQMTLFAVTMYGPSGKIITYPSQSSAPTN